MKKLIAYLVIVIISLVLIGSLIKGLDYAIEIFEIVPWWAWFFITPFVVTSIFPDDKKN